MTHIIRPLILWRDIESIIILRVPPPIQTTLTPCHRVTSSQLHDLGRLLPSLHLKYGAQTHIFTQGLESAVDIPRPNERPDQKWHKEEGKDEGFAEGEDPYHEDEEYDDAPNQANEGNRPGLTLRFVGFIEDCRE